MMGDAAVERDRGKIIKTFERHPKKHNFWKQ